MQDLGELANIMSPEKKNGECRKQDRIYNRSTPDSLYDRIEPIHHFTSPQGKPHEIGDPSAERTRLAVSSAFKQVQAPFEVRDRGGRFYVE
mgnify:CR=1 FL=1